MLGGDLLPDWLLAFYRCFLKKHFHENINKAIILSNSWVAV
jgi:hypothetical protein